MMVRLIRIIPLAVLVSILVSCNGTSTVGGIVESPSLSPIPTLTTFVIATVTKTPTHQPTLTATPTLVEGESPQSELNQKITQWLNGDTILSENDRLLDEVTALPLSLGLLRHDYPDTFYLIYYVIGYTVIYDADGIPYVVGIMGFEDRQGAKFTLPIHAGKFFEDCGDILLEIFNAKQINKGTYTLSEVFIPPLSFIKYSNLLNDTIVVSYISTGSPYRTASDCRNKSWDYFDFSSEASIAILDFLECEMCTVKNLPPILGQWVNLIPDLFSNQMIYTFDYNGHVK